MGAPLAYLVKAPRTGEMVAWLKCNDVDPGDVPYPTTVYIETADGERWFIRFEAYTRGESGFIRYDPVADSFELAERRVELVNDPPMWWLQEVPLVGDASDS